MSSAPPPILCQWDGEAFVPQARFARLCDREFVVGETYALTRHEERSSASHRHYFAALNEAWRNLPEDVAEAWPTPEHLRKWALVRAGFADERSIVCASKAEAQRIAAFVKPMDQFAIVVARDATIKVFTPQSQSVKAMGKAAFQDSKQKVLDIVAGLLGVSSETLALAGDRAQRTAAGDGGMSGSTRKLQNLDPAKQEKRQ